MSMILTTEIVEAREAIEGRVMMTIIEAKIGMAKAALVGIQRTEVRI